MNLKLTYPTDGQTRTFDDVPYGISFVCLAKVTNVSIRIEPSNPTIGTTVKITCLSVVYPQPDYILFRNEIKIPNHDGVGAQLVSDQGATNYTCVARNILGIVSQSFILNIAGKI